MNLMSDCLSNPRETAPVPGKAKQKTRRLSLRMGMISEWRSLRSRTDMSTVFSLFKG